jgi:ADP-heptose:LPS heptosyltransferase
LNPQVLLITQYGLGDQALMLPLLHRLQQEWPGVVVDLLARQELKEAASFMPVRHVYTNDYKAWNVEQYFTGTIHLPDDPWRHTVYDRVLSFFLPLALGGYLGSAVRARERRGVFNNATGKPVPVDDWWRYSAIGQPVRDLNLFHFGDMYALSGSGPGPFHAPQVTVPRHAHEWAAAQLHQLGQGVTWIAIHVGASITHKRWRPQYYGQVMALLSKQVRVGFVLTGTAGEREAASEALTVYHQAGGTAPAYDAVGRTDLAHSLGLLSQCRLMLANDTGLMHWGAAVGCQVLNVSVGPVTAQESAAYGPGHWAIQPDIACSPCTMFDPCSHQACKDLVQPEQVSELVLHALGLAPLPTHWPGVKVYHSTLDADDLVRYEQVGGMVDHETAWWALYWRRYWYERFTGLSSRVEVGGDAAPSLEGVDEKKCQLGGLLFDLQGSAERYLGLLEEGTASQGELDRLKQTLVEQGQAAVDLALTSPALKPLALWAGVRMLEAQGAGTAVEVVRREMEVFREWYDTLAGMPGKNV